MQTDDGELVRQARRGDRHAFGELVGRYRDMVYGAAYHYLGNAEDAQDAAQEAFVQAYGRLGQLREPEKFAPWLRRLVRNLSVDHRRRRDRPVFWDAPCADTPLDRLTTRLAVREALGRLSETVRLTVTLSYLGGYSHAEVARFLGIPLATVRSRLQHAKRQLRQEMRDMVQEELDAGRPGETWTLETIEEALRRGEGALKAYERGEALRLYDQALTALDGMPPGAEHQRLRLDALRRKAGVIRYAHGREETIGLLEQALALAREAGDRHAEAEIEEGLAAAYSSHDKELAQTAAHYEKALDIYRELGDAYGQGNCLLFLGMHFASRNEVAAARPCFLQAMPLFARADAENWIAVCRAMTGLLDARGAGFDKLLFWAAVCDTLEQHEGVTRFAGQPGFMVTRRPDGAPAALFISSVFSQVSHLRTFLDARAPVGGSWSGSAFSYADQPLQATVTVLSDKERVATPAGMFDRCLLTEQVTTQPGEASDRMQQLNLSANCGTARAWYAPGVGLVQLHVRHDDGSEAAIQLQDHTVADGDTGYLPLAIGNRWEYGWAGLPAEYAAREVCQVTARQGDTWHLAHYGWVEFLPRLAWGSPPQALAPRRVPRREGYR